MKTVQILFACIAMNLTTNAVSAMDICGQDVGMGCRDSGSGKVYVPYGNKLVGPGKKQVFLEVETSKPYVQTYQDRADGSRAETMDADLQEQKYEAALMRRTAEKLKEPSVAEAERQVVITLMYGADDAEERPSTTWVLAPAFTRGHTSLGAINVLTGNRGHISDRHGRFFTPAESSRDISNAATRPATPDHGHSHQR